MVTIWNGWYWHLVSALVAISGALATLSDRAIAQITPDGTLPNNSIVTPQGNTNIIDGGTTVGGNLFHSFEQFSVPIGGEAYFNNAPDIQNILSRVTGGSISNIEGLLQANGKANLFLLNPNGIMFGPQAMLNIGGSFVGSTASSLNFADGTSFSATAPQNIPLLTVSVPLGLQFGENPGSIVNQSQAQSLSGETNSAGEPVGLQVFTGQTLALVGGDVVLESGNLTAAGGRIELGSVAGVGEVSLSQTGNKWVLGYDENNTFGDIQLQGGLLVDASGKGGGDIQIQGARLEITQGANIWADTLGVGDGGEVLIRTNEAIALSNGSSITADVYGSGTGGDLVIATGRLLVSDGAVVSASTYGTGDGGTLSVTASGAIEVIDNGVLTAQTQGEGNAGDLTIATGRLTVRDGAQVSARTTGIGAGGRLSVTASDVVEVIGRSGNGKNVSALLAQSEGKGNAGDLKMGNGGELTIATGRLLVHDGAVVSASNFGTGNGGTLSVTASDAIEVIDSTLAAQSEGDGNAGDLTIATGRLLMSDEARISTGTLGKGDGGTLSVTASDAIKVIDSILSAQTEGEGNAGDLTIATGRLLVRDGGQIATSTFGTGDGGTLSVTASDAIEVIGTSAVSKRPSVLAAAVDNGGGDAGDLTITTGRLLVRDGALVTAANTGGIGDGGTLSITASDAVEVIGTSTDGRASVLSTQTEGNGNAGDLTIATGRLTVRNGARVSASTFGPGAGGSLSVTASDVVELSGTSANSQIASGLFATTEGNGNAGDLTIVTGRLLVRDRAAVAVRSLELGNPGELRVEAGSVLLENQGGLLASTVSGERGNIDLQVQDLILMRANSLISAEASGTGNGGNITINAPFIIAVPAEDNDIIANAIQGRGGNIFITTRGIYGLEYRSNRTSASDINASSRFGVSGTVEINNPDVDSNQGLVELPAELVDASNQIITGCARSEENEFIITGRGGLPPNPKQVLSSNAVQVEWVELDAAAENRASVERGAREQRSRGAGRRENRSATPYNMADVNRPVREIVEAQGWITDANGNVTLVATAPTAMPHSSWQTPADCRAVERQ